MTLAATNLDDQKTVRLHHHFEHLPIGFFGSVMGLTGLSVAWRLAHMHFGTPALAADLLAALAIVAFAGVSIGYGIKIATAPNRVLEEFRHPIAGNLFGTFFISLLLLPILIAPANLLLARIVWAAAAAAMVVFAWLIVNRWMGSRQQVQHATPAWIVPVVGLLDVPLAAPALNIPQVQDFMVFAFAVGLSSPFRFSRLSSQDWFSSRRFRMP